jgi:hypothetical protein
MASLATLPDDLVLEISSHLTIDAFLNFRLLNKGIHEVLGTRILSVSDSIARNTFPYQTRIFHDPSGNSCPRGLYWLKELRYRQLAAISLELNGALTGISAEDGLGDRLRRKLQKGWQVVAELAQLVQKARDSRRTLAICPHRLDPIDEVCAIGSASRKRSHWEFEVLRLWEEHVQVVTLEGLQGFSHIWNNVLPKMLGWMRFVSVNHPDQWSWPVAGKRFSATAWARWTLVKVGSDNFWKAWWDGWTTPYRTLLVDWVHREWSTTQRWLEYVQCAASQQFTEDFSARKEEVRNAVQHSWLEPHGQEARYVDGLFRCIRVCAQAGQQYRTGELVHMGREAPPMVFDKVPFHQWLRWDEMGLEGGGGECKPGTPRRPRRRPIMWVQRLEEAEAYVRWEDILISDADRGLVDLSQKLPPRDKGGSAGRTLAEPAALRLANFDEIMLRTANSCRERCQGLEVPQIFLS